MNPITASRVHLQNSKTNYLEHFYQAFKLGLILIWSGFASILHSIFPYLYPAYSANKVIWMYVRFVVDNPNPEIQAFLEQELALRDTRIARVKSNQNLSS